MAGALLAGVRHPAPSYSCAWTALPHSVDASEPVEFLLSVRQRNLDELERIALAVSTPGNARYGQYLEQHEVDALMVSFWDSLHKFIASKKPFLLAKPKRDVIDQIEHFVA